MLSSEVPLPSERSFGLTFAAVFGIVSGLAVWRGWLGGELWKYTLGISLGLLIFVLTVPIILRPLNRAWMRFGELLHRIVSPVMLGLIYFVVISPVALFFKITGRDELRRKYDIDAESYWITREPAGPDAPSSFTRQF